MSYISIENQKNHQIWRIHRPERGNALGPTIARDLLQAVHNLRDSVHKPRALVITATPLVKEQQCTWIAGGDLKELADLHTADEARTYVALLSDALQTLDELPLPVIIAIDGAAIGGGAEIALAGDLRLATARSELEFRQLKAGLATGYGTSRRLVELIGLSRTQGLLYRTATISSAQAAEYGLIHQVVADAAALEATVSKVCADLADLDPAALAAQKRMLWHAVRSHPSSARSAELELFATLWRNPGHSAFLDQFKARGSEAKS